MEEKKYDELNNLPASRDFRETLKAKILEARHKKQYMKNFLPSVSSLFTVRRMAPVLALLVVVALIITTVRIFPGVGPSGKFAKLIISPAYAMDNFEVTATAADSAGVDSDTAFVIKSKETIDAADLKKSLSLLPAVDFSLEKISDNEFKVVPKAPLAGKTVYRLAIAASYIAETGAAVTRDYSWAFQVKDAFRVYTTIPGNMTTNVPLNAGIEIMFSHENSADYAKYITLEPAAAGRFEQHKRTVVFIPQKLNPATIYTVTVSRELPLSGSDLRLVDDYKFSFETGEQYRDKQSWFSPAREYSEFSTNEEPVFEMHMDDDSAGLNVSAEIFSFADADDYVKELDKRAAFPRWSSLGRENFRVNTAELVKVATLSLKPQKNQWSYFLLFLEKMPAGFYAVNLKTADAEKQIFFQVSDLAVYTAVSENDTLVWVNDIATGSALPGAVVQASKTNLNVVTGADGVARFATTESFGAASNEEKEMFLTVKGAGKATVIPFWYGRNYHDTNDDFYSHFYTDRAMYQPTDLINIWGFATGRDGQKIQGDWTAELVSSGYYDYYYEPLTLAKVDLQRSASGAISGKLAISNANPGYYTLNLKMGDKLIHSRGISVEAYVKPAYEVTLKPEKRALMAGEKIKFEAGARFFDGTAVPGLELSAQGLKAGEQKLVTDANGKVSFSVPTYISDCKLKDVLACHQENPYYQYLTLTAAKAEDGDIYAHETAMVFNSAVYTKIKTEQKQNVINISAREIDFVALNARDESYGELPGAPAAGHAVVGRIIELVQKKTETGEYYDFLNKVVRKKYDYRTEEVKVADFEGVLDVQGEFNYPFVFGEGKSYRVRAAVRDDAGRPDFAESYSYDFDYYDYDWDNYELTFTNVKDENIPAYNVDDEVQLVFRKNNKNMADGEKANFLYYKQRKGLLDYAVQKQAAYSFVFTKEMVPNVYVAGVWFDGRSYHRGNGGYWYGGGFLTVRYDYDNNKTLKIEVTSDKQKYEPGAEVKLDVKITDKNGLPVAANVNLNLVDEAYYKLVGDYVNPLTELYRNVSSGEKTYYDSHHELVLKGGAEGGGCFLAGTQVLMADGSKKSIEKIAAGDRILTFASERDGRLVAASVEKTFRHVVEEYLIINNFLRVTPEHRVFVNGGWQMIGEARVGDRLRGANGEAVEIETIRRVKASVPVYNLMVSGLHTYIADDVYVHNDKGGARSDFRDTALFAAVETNALGKTSVSFKLPDNLTSWRVTSQAISGDLEAGKSVTNIIVSLPVFVDAVLAGEYLTADEPVLKARAFGDKLTAEDKVKLSVESTKALKQAKETKAFVSEYFEIGKMSAGEQKFKVGVNSAKGNDALIKTTRVVESRVTEQTADFYQLKTGMKIKGGETPPLARGGETGRTTLLFTDAERGSIYGFLTGLTYDSGDRLDQALARQMGAALLQKYFAEKFEVPEFVASTYQTPEGGLALLPYAEADLALSAKAAALAPSYFNREWLAVYFSKFLNDREATAEQVSLALWGMGSLGEPVLGQIENMAKIESLSVQEKLFVALAAEEIGAAELARGLYLDVMKKFAETKEPYVRLNIGKDADDIVEATALAAVLAERLNDVNSEKLWNYLTENWQSEQLNYLEMLNFADAFLGTNKLTELSFAVEYGNEKVEKTLKFNEPYRLSLTAEELANLKVTAVNGRVGLVAVYEKSGIGAVKDADVKIDRRYFVGNKETNKFKEGDLVEIRIYPQFGAKAIDGFYQVTDILPSGLKVITKPYWRGLSYNCGYRYPYGQDGNKVKFGVFRSDVNSTHCRLPYFKYYARVASLGKYVAEPVMIQSLKSLAIKNYSAASAVEISR